MVSFSKQCASRIISSGMLSSPHLVQLICTIYSNYVINISINRLGTSQSRLVNHTPALRPLRASMCSGHRWACFGRGQRALGRPVRSPCTGLLPGWCCWEGSDRWECHTNSSLVLVLRGACQGLKVPKKNTKPGIRRPGFCSYVVFLNRFLI